MSRNLSRLAILMDHFNITGRELANTLHVDFTLVSKWRNRKRVLSPRSGHLKKIAEYFIALDSKNNLNTLSEILTETYPNAQLKSASEISTFLCKWLSDRDQKIEGNDTLFSLFSLDNAHKSNLYVFKGNDGRREAVLKFQKIAITPPCEGKEIFIFTQEDSSWFTENKEFIDFWREKETEFLRKGGKIHVVHTVDRLYKSIAISLFSWLPIHTIGNSHSYLYPQYLDSPLKTTLYIIKDRAAIFGFTVDGLTKNLHTYLCFEPMIIERFHYIFQSILDGSPKLFEEFPFKKSSDLFKLVVKAGSARENSFFVSAPPSLAIMSNELLNKILSYNNINDKEINTIIEKHKILNDQFDLISKKHRYRFIYYVNIIESMLAENETLFQELSLITGKKIIIRRDDLRQFFYEMISLASKIENLEVALLEDPPIDGTENINLWAKENTILLSSTAFHHTDSFFSIAAREPTAVNPCFYYIDQVWNAIPQMKRDIVWVNQKLHQIITRSK